MGTSSEILCRSDRNVGRQDLVLSLEDAVPGIFDMRPHGRPGGIAVTLPDSLEDVVMLALHEGEPLPGLGQRQIPGQVESSQNVGLH